MVGEMSKQVVSKTRLSGPALYGKIPAHGDFISRGLQREQISEIDNWLTAWFERAKTDWGQSFEDNYRASQPWIFSGEHIAAILMPSFDRVERLFPLFVCVGAGARAQRLYDAAFSAIAEPQTVELLFEDLKTIKCDAETTDAKGWFLPDAKEVAMPHPFFGDDTDWVRGAVQ